MKKIEIHVRYLTSDYDYGEGPGTLFDNDANEGAARATHSVLKYLQHLANSAKYLGKYRAFNNDAVLRQVEPALVKIARSYWRDLDYDDRMKLSDVREEVSKLISALTNAVDVLSQRPPYVRAALNSEARRLAPSRVQQDNDIFDFALQANVDLLSACNYIKSRDREKPGEAVKVRNACYELAQLWEDMLGRKFPKTTKYSSGKLEPMTGVPAVFDSPAAQFAYIAIFQIGRDWVKPAQVEAGIKALAKRKTRSSPTE